MRAYSMDLRERALLDSDAGMKAADVATKYPRERVVGPLVETAPARNRRNRAAPPATRPVPDARAAPSHVGGPDRGATGSHAGGTEGRARHPGECANRLAGRAGLGPDR